MLPGGHQPLTRSTVIWLAGVVLLALSACGEPPRYQPLPPGRLVLAFGDSVTYGTGAPEDEAWPNHFWRMTGLGVVNAGIPGDMARDARRRLPELLTLHQPDLVVIELGGNDFLRKRSESLVKEDLRAMIRATEQAGAIPVLVAVPRLSLLRASTGTLKDSAIYAELAEENGVVLVEDVFSDILSTDELKADEIHPNGAGYRVLAEGIVDTLGEAGLL